MYEEKDQAFNIGVGRTRSRRTSCSGMGSLTTSEARFLPADQPAGELAARRAACRTTRNTTSTITATRFYIRVNDTGRNFRLVKAPVASPGRESWKEVVAAPRRT